MFSTAPSRSDHGRLAESEKRRGPRSGKQRRNNEDDVFATDNALREIGAYAPPPEYAHEPQRYATEPMVDALEKVQEQNGLRVDGYAKPDGPTERAINNGLLGKPRGAGLLHDFTMSVGDTVGNGFKNAPRDVETVKRALGGLGYLPEDPFDRPSGFIEESTTKAIKRFQDDNRLTANGWLGPKGETEAALRQAVDRLARVKRPEWLEYHRRAPSPEALKGVGIVDNPAEAARLAAQLFKNAGRGALLEIGESGSRFANAEPQPRIMLADERTEEGMGSPSSDPNYNFGETELKRSDVLPEGVEPPANPLKPDVLPRDMSGEMPQYDVEGRVAPIDVGVDRKREVRSLISRLYRVGAEDSEGRPRLTDEEFDSYLAAAKEHIRPEHYPVSELTARAVRARALDWHTAATRLTAYFVPESSGEAFVGFFLDLIPVIGQAKAAKEVHGHLADAADAAAYGDARAHDEALTKAAIAMVAVIMPGAGSGALKAAAKLLKKELHHLVPIYLGGIKNGPLLPISASEHRLATDSLHGAMREFHRKYDRGLISSWVNPGWRIVAGNRLQKRVDALDAFYRSLEKSPIRHHWEAFEAWQQIFPEIQKYFRR